MQLHGTITRHMSQQHHESAQIRVLRIITRLNIGGPAIQAISLSRRLPSKGFPTTLVHGRLGPGEGDMQTLLCTDGLGAVLMPALRRDVDPLSDLRAFWQMLKLLRQLRPNIVHTHMAKAGAIGRQATIAYNALWARDRPAKLVHTYHGHVLEGYFSVPKTAVFLTAERLLARRTDALVAVSRRIRDELLDTYRIGQADRFQVVPLGFDLSSLASIDDAARRSPKFSRVGRLDPGSLRTAGDLHAVADAQDRNAQVEEFGVGLGCSLGVDAGRSTREDQSPWVDLADSLGREIVSHQPAKDVLFADSPGDQLGRLRTEVENQDLVMFERLCFAAIVACRGRDRLVSGGQIVGGLGIGVHGRRSERPLSGKQAF